MQTTQSHDIVKKTRLARNIFGDAMHTRRFLLFVALSLSLLAFPAESSAKTKMSASEVKEIFIGTPWRGPHGFFLFRKDGTYTYQNFKAKKPLGTWTYKITKDGKLVNGDLSYTFYKREIGGYLYFHSRSGRFYKAVPNQKAPFK